MPPRWEQALGPVPVQVLRVPPGPDAGLNQLIGVRDWWVGVEGGTAPAIAFTRALVHLRAASVGKAHPDTLYESGTLGALLHRAGQPEGAELLERAWAVLGEGRPARADDLRLAVLAQNVAGARLRRGELEQAEQPLERAYEIRQAAAPESTGLVAAQLAEVRVALGRGEEAVALLRESVERTAQREGPTSPRARARVQMLGTVLNQLGRHGEAAKVLRPLAAGLPGDTHPEVRASVAFELGLALQRTGGREEALRRVEEALRLTRPLGDGAGGPHPSLANRVTLMAELEVQRGRLEVADGLLREAVDLDRRRHGDNHPEVAMRYAGLGRFQVRFGRPDEGLGWMDAACSLLRTTVGDDDVRTGSVVAETVELYLAQATTAAAARDRGLAQALARRALELGPAVLGHDHALLRRVRELRDKHRL